MDQPDPSTSPESDLEQDSPEERSRVGRRSFLKASALGAGAMALPSLGRNTATAAAASTDDCADAQSASAAPATTTVDYKTQADTWVEPWEFVQKDWPGQQLTLDVVEHGAPVALFGDIGAAQDANVGQLLFSWNGISPAPTMRIGGNEILKVKVRNMLGPNDGVLNIPNGTVPPSSVTTPAEWIAGGYTDPTHDYCRPIHTNHKHQIRTTNIHFHGSHVAPYQNEDGSHSDDIFLRIVPQEDQELRQKSQDPGDSAIQDPVCWPLAGSEIMGQADYQYRLGSTGGARETHPPGTHWYHPHAHGSTFTQVASGMAGLVIVEGDVDEYLKKQLTNPDPNNESDSFNERAIVIQRIVGPAAVDVDAGFEKDGQFKTKSSAVFAAVNGQSVTSVDNYIVLAPEAVERWRVLNAGVDGQAYLDFLVLDLENPNDLSAVLDAGAVQTITWVYRKPAAPITLTITVKAGGSPITWTKEQDGNTTSGSGAEILEELYAQVEEYQYVKRAPDAFFHHLASDGITLVNKKGEYHSRPVSSPQMMSPANRADFLFQAPAVPQGADYRLLSIWIRQNLTGSDAKFASAGGTGTKFLQRIATIITRGEATPPPAINPLTKKPLDLSALVFPTVPGYLLPVSDEDITVKASDPDYDKKTLNSGTRDNNNGKRRGRLVLYSGWGGGTFPAGSTNRGNELQAYNGNPQGSVAQTGGVSGPESMMIDCRKFNDDPAVLHAIGHHMLKGTAEEWTVANFSMTLFSDDPTGDPSTIPPDTDNREQNLADQPYATAAQKLTLATRAVDHPFHIHINPCWVTGIYDWKGRALNWNYEPNDTASKDNKFYPRWHDVLRLPRMGGYVVFRSRFWDFSGEYVNHCHILQHEDNGMMQGIEVILDPDQADYIPLSSREGFRRPTWHECYTLDWGVGGTQEQANEDRAVCDAVRAALRTPT